MKRIVLLAPLLLSGCNWFDSAIVKECESGLLDKVRTPSGYSRISADEYSEPATEATIRSFYANWWGSHYTDAKAAAESALNNPNVKDFVLKTVFIKYDAPNAFGTPVRGIVECKWIARSKDDHPVGPSSLLFNDKAWVNWLTD